MDGYFLLSIHIESIESESYLHGERGKMNEEHMITSKCNLEANPLGKTDWDRVDAMSEEELTAAACDDPDNPPLTPEMLARFKLVPDVKAIRQKLHLSQQQFSLRYHVPVRTLQEWEQKRSIPDTTAIAFLTAIANNPKAIDQALNRGG